jgi:hypothetical protein
MADGVDAVQGLGKRFGVVNVGPNCFNASGDNSGKRRVNTVDLWI